MLKRRDFLARVTGLAALGLAGRQASLHALTAGRGDAGEPEITIYKSKSCGCCGKWVEHIKANRFRVVVHDREDMDEVKDWLGVPRDLRSCHTGQVGGYLVEGHVPASDIRAILAKRPKISGLTVPGMPAGTPGMAMPGMEPEPYEVLAFQRDGTTKLFAKH
jgi:hypothetical protein